MKALCKCNGLLLVLFPRVFRTPSGHTLDGQKVPTQLNLTERRPYWVISNTTSLSLTLLGIIIWKKLNSEWVVRLVLPPEKDFLLLVNIHHYQAVDGAPGVISPFPALVWASLSAGWSRAVHTSQGRWSGLTRHSALSARDGFQRLAETLCWGTELQPRGMGWISSKGQHQPSRFCDCGGPAWWTWFNSGIAEI